VATILESMTPKQERSLLLTLAGIQFTHILDFMVMMPLGPLLKSAFGISAAQFGLLVSAYTLSAGACGLLASTFMDRFGRRRLLVALYVGFAVATLACALAPSYALLMGARIAAGAFGGVLGALVQTIIGDVIPFERRGRAMGLVMSAFSLSTVAGVPGSLLLASHFDWHAPFWAIGAAALVLAVVAWRTLPPMRGHLGAAREVSPWEGIRQTLDDRNHWRAFAFVSLMMFAGFTVIPFITIVNVTNGVIEQKLIPIVYFFGGLATFFTSRLIGAYADKRGKAVAYSHLSWLAIPFIVGMTLLPPMPIWALTLFFVGFFVFVPGRMVPGMALVTGAADPKLRGTFMSLMSSVQSFSSGLAASVGGAIIVLGPDGLYHRYWMVACLAVSATLLAMWVAMRIRTS
jgi:predicted MFS family arabinose efflux permease